MIMHVVKSCLHLQTLVGIRFSGSLKKIILAHSLKPLKRQILTRVRSNIGSNTNSAKRVVCSPGRGRKEGVAARMLTSSNSALLAEMHSTV